MPVRELQECLSPAGTGVESARSTGVRSEKRRCRGLEREARGRRASARSYRNSGPQAAAESLAVEPLEDEAAAADEVLDSAATGVGLLLEAGDATLDALRESVA